MSQLIERLKSEFEGAGLLLDDQIGERYAADWSEMAAEKPIAVMRPNSTEQLAKMLVICNELAQPVVIQGGMTGLAGAATPFNGEVALTLERMSGVEEIDPDSMTMTVLAGTPLQEAQERARAAGLYLPLDLGARGSCTIGGNVANNSGGPHCLA
ncbi:MAG: FAD-binding oxidoreductase, partial [Haliea sp.]